MSQGRESEDELLEGCQVDATFQAGADAGLLYIACHPGPRKDRYECRQAQCTAAPNPVVTMEWLA
jgi:hypothetical protein